MLCQKFHNEKTHYAIDLYVGNRIKEGIICHLYLIWYAIIQIELCKMNNLI